MPVTDLTPRAVVNELVARVAAWGVPGAEAGRPIDVPTGVWPALLPHLASKRISGLAIAAARAGALDAPEEQWDALLSQQRVAMGWCLAVERTLLRAARWLDDAGVPFVVLKGPALAHTLYPDPTWRAFDDLDLLVRTRDWRRACALFEGRGYPRELPEPRRGFDERFGKAAVFTTEDGVQIDLHRTLVLGPFGLWLDPEELFEGTEPVTIGGRSMSRLRDTEQLLHVCLHAALGSQSPRLQPLRDVLQVASAGDVDWTRLAWLARRWKLMAVVRQALGTATRVLHAPFPERAAAFLAYRPTPREQRLLRAYTMDGSRRGGTALATLAAIPGPRARVAYARALLVPDREFLMARSGATGTAAYRRRLSIPVGWLRGRRSWR